MWMLLFEEFPFSKFGSYLGADVIKAAEVIWEGFTQSLDSGVPFLVSLV